MNLGGEMPLQCVQAPYHSVEDVSAGKTGAHFLQPCYLLPLKEKEFVRGLLAAQWPLQLKKQRPGLHTLLTSQCQHVLPQNCCL